MGKILPSAREQENTVNALIAAAAAITTSCCPPSESKSTRPATFPFSRCRCNGGAVLLSPVLVEVHLFLKDTPLMTYEPPPESNRTASNPAGQSHTFTTITALDPPNRKTALKPTTFTSPSPSQRYHRTPSSPETQIADTVRSPAHPHSTPPTPLWAHFPPLPTTALVPP